MPVIVIPAYDEATNVPSLLADLECRPSLWRLGKVLLVDDGSTDGTPEIAEANAGRLPLEVLRLGENRGPGRAFDAGFRRALELCGRRGQIVTLESDTTSDLDVLDQMLAIARDGADVVLASVHGGGRMLGVGRTRRLMSRGASLAIRRAAGLDARTVSSFFRVYRARALRAGYERHGDSFIRESGFACKAEILMKLDALGAEIAEVPVDLDAARRNGESKLRLGPTIAGYMRLLSRNSRVRAEVGGPLARDEVAS